MSIKFGIPVSSLHTKQSVMHPLWSLLLISWTRCMELHAANAANQPTDQDILMIWFDFTPGHDYARKCKPYVVAINSQIIFCYNITRTENTIALPGAQFETEKTR